MYKLEMAKPTVASDEHNVTLGSKMEIILFFLFQSVLSLLFPLSAPLLVHVFFFIDDAMVVLSFVHTPIPYQFTVLMRSIDEYEIEVP